MRRFTSLLLAFTFVVLTLTGLGLTFKKQLYGALPPQQQGAAYNPAQKSGSLPLKAAHEWAGYAFIAAGCCHWVLNRRCLGNYVGLNAKKSRSEKSA